MPLRVLIIPDKFKGTLTAAQAAEAIADGWRQARPDDTLDLMPMSDGGDGFGELLGRQLQAQPQHLETVDAAHRPLRAVWWWQPDLRLAILESARVIGLAQLPPGRYHPFELDTRGLGELLRAAARRQPRLCLMGIGGSATNDGGFGLARALGWRFRNVQGKDLGRWTELAELSDLRRPARLPLAGRLQVAVDVRNLLLGVQGASRVYGPQKGLRTDDIPPAERCLRRLARVVERQFRARLSPARLPGSGAAGGLGFGLRVFCGAKLTPGFSLFARHTGVAQRIRRADLVITGEGAIDRTTVLMGKGVGEVARLARHWGKPCLGLGGRVGQLELVQRYFTQVDAIVPDLASYETVRQDPAAWLRALARRSAWLAR